MRFLRKKTVRKTYRKKTVRKVHRRKVHKKSFRKDNISRLITTTIKPQFSKLKTTYSCQMVGDSSHTLMYLSAYMNSIYYCDNSSALTSPANVRGLSILGSLFTDYLVHSSKIKLRISPVSGTSSPDCRFYLVPYKNSLGFTGGAVESTIADMPQAKHRDFQTNQNKPVYMSYAQSCHKVVGISKQQYHDCVLTDTPTFLFGPSGAITSTTPTANGSVFWNLLCYNLQPNNFTAATLYFEINVEITYFVELVNRIQLTQS
nr:MAG: capsid protein [Cressdnaviricota sp.]